MLEWIMGGATAAVLLLVLVLWRRVRNLELEVRELQLLQQPIPDFLSPEARAGWRDKVL